jgi:hypothetical protein
VDIRHSDGFFIDPPQFVVVSEICPTTLHANGIALGFSVYFVGAIIFTTPAATAPRTIGWKMYLGFMSCSNVSIVIMYFLLPETVGKSLEDIGELFGNEVVVHLTKDGHGIVEQENAQVIHIEDIKTG